MNRRQKRAQANKDGSSKSGLTSAADIPLGKPDTTNAKRNAKTLLEIAAERQAQLKPEDRTFTPTLDGSNVVQVKIGPDGQIIESSEPLIGTAQAIESEAESPWLDTVLLATSLTALHLTLETLTVHQYAEELVFKPIITHALFVALPTLTFIIHLFHGHLVALPAGLSQGVRDGVFVLQQLLYLIIANAAGCYLIYLTNDQGYFAVMKKAPSIGTLWIWAVLELGLVGALLGAAGPGLYAWYHGYSIT